MYLPEIESEYKSAIERSKADKLCWLAQDILVSYSLHEDSADLFEPEVIGQDDSVFYDGVHHKRTRCLDIGENVMVTLDSVPILLDEKDKLQKLVEPGYVAMLCIDIADIDTLLNERTTVDISSDTCQVIFRLPWHSEGTGIFQGFGVSEDSRIDDDEESLIAAKDLLEAFREILQDDLMEESTKETTSYGDSEAYAVQNYPIRPFAALFLDFIDIENAKRKD